jgi:hypothetical protein
MAMIETRSNADGTTSYRVKVRLRGFPTQTATFARKANINHKLQSVATQYNTNHQTLVTILILQ